MTYIPIDKITPNPQQPRTVFDQSELEDLAQSMAENGLILPVVVETLDGEEFTLVDGERRWRAAQILNWQEIEATVRPSKNGSGSQERLLHAVVANLQRSDLGPIDEANAYEDLNRMGLTQAQIAEKVGRSMGHVGNRLRMLDFPEPVRDLLNDRAIPIDMAALEALRKLPESQMITVARAAAAKRSTAGTIRAMCTRISKQRVKKQEKPEQNEVKSSTCPPVDLNKMPTQYLWLEKPARATCRACGLYDDLSLCKECPLVQFIGKVLNGIE